MKYISKDQTTRHESSPACTAFEYDTGSKDINIARIEINGRYPESGCAVNTLVTEIVYVESGSGVVIVGDENIELATGDVIQIDRGEQVYWEGTLTLIIACTPAWYPEQYQVGPETVVL